MADDSTSLFWNPAGLSYLKKRELGISHAEMYGQVRMESMVYAHPTKFGAFAAGLSYLGHGSVESRDENGAKAGNFSASERLVVLGLARRMGFLSLGGGVKIIQLQIAEASAVGYAADLGASAAIARSLRLGFSALNVGPPIKWRSQSDQLPLTLSAGLAWTPMPQVLLSADVSQRPHANKAGLGMGMELEAYRGLFLRAGYLSAAEGAGAGSYAPAISRIRAGMGLRLFNKFSMDYSFAPAGDVGTTQRLSLGYRF